MRNVSGLAFVDYFKNFFRLRHHQMVSVETLDMLFLMERSTLITQILFETILLYILISRLGNMLLVWYGLIVTLTLWRLYNAYDYKYNPQRHSPIVWHKKFVVQVWATALLFALLALFGIPHLEGYYQLLTVIMLAGISSGAVRAMPEDYRTAMGYLLIVLLPLSVEMALLMRSDTYIIALLLVLFLSTQAGIIMKAYAQSIALQEKEAEKEKTREELNDVRQRMQLFFAQSSEGIVSYDADQRILNANQAFLDLFGLERDAVVGHRLHRLEDEALAAIFREALQRNGEPYTASYTVKTDEPYRERWIKVKCSELVDAKGNPMGGIGYVQDETREQMALLELEYLASHDPLTHALNRRGFMRYMEEMLDEERHTGWHSLLFYFDMDNFKHINDRYGHDVGDKVLIEAARRIRRLSGNLETRVARLGGDEFCLVVPFVTEERDRIQPTIDVWLEGIRQAFLTPFLIDGHALDIYSSVGVVVINANERNIEKVVAHADIAMIQAKRSGLETKAIIYDDELGRRHRQVYEVQHALESAFEMEQLVVYYQPIVDVQSGRLVSAEALVRWRHPERGLIVPVDFLPIAVESGQVTRIDWWVLEQTIRQIADWQHQGIFSLEYVSVNMDVQSLIQPDIVERIVQLLNRFEVESSCIRIEVTESSLIKNIDRTRRAIEELYRHGIGCAIDDFGTGYSSLSYLRTFQFEILKIDREFIRDALERVESITMVQTIIQMARQFHCTVVVEGVELPVQREMLANLGVELYYQGFLSSQPLAARTFGKLFLREEGNDAEASRHHGLLPEQVT